MGYYRENEQEVLTMKEPNFSDKQLGRNIRDIRLNKGMTLEEFCNEFDNPQPSASIISRWERGVSTPNPKRLKKLCEIGDIEMNDLYKRGIDFFDGQLENLSIAYEENRSKIKHDISQSYNFFSMGHIYLSLATKKDNIFLTEYEELLYLINQFLDPKMHRAYNNRYSIIKTDIVNQLDKLHMLMTYPTFISDAKAKLEEIIDTESKASVDNTAAMIMKNAKIELLTNGAVSEKTIKAFCTEFDFDKDFAVYFLNNKGNTL